LACLYANGLYHSVGCNNGVGGPNTILYSEDGKTWNPSAGTPFLATDGTGYATGIAFGSGNGNGGIWVCSGVQNTLTPNFSLLWSSNGSNWNPAASVSFGVGAVMDVTFDGSKFLALCVGGTTAAGRNVCMSFDGSNWTNVGITGGDFNNLPRYVTGSNGVFVATTGNPGQSLVYSLDGGYSWQSNTTLSSCNVPIYKPYFDSLKWWVGVETTDGSQSIYYTMESAPALSNWVNGSFTGGFSNGAVARAFTSTDGQSNVTAILNSTIFGLSQTFTTSNFNASTISVGKAYVGELNASTLYIGVTFVSTTYETINNISTQNVDFISAGTIVSSRNFMDSLSVNRMSVGQAYIGQGLDLAGGVPYGSLKIQGGCNANAIFIKDALQTSNNGYIIGNDLNFTEASTFVIGRVDAGTVQQGKAIYLTQAGRVGINTSTPQYQLDVNGQILAKSTVSYEQRSTNPLPFQFAIQETGNSIGQQKLKFQTYYTPLVGSGSVIQSTDEFGGFDHGTELLLNPLGGNVGINTSTPQYTLDVKGTARFFPDTITNNPLSFEGSGDDFYMNWRHLNTNSTIAQIEMNGYLQTDSNSGQLMFRTARNGVLNLGIRINEDGLVGINTTTPIQTLDVNGSVWARSTLYVGSNTSTNQIRFYGTKGDGAPPDTTFTHTVIGEYLYGDAEQSELILFKGDNAASSGPDRVRVLAAGGFRVDTGGTITWAEGGAPPTAAYENALVVSGENGRVGIGTATPTHTLQTIGNICVATGSNGLLEGGAINFGIAELSNYSPMSLIKGALTQTIGSECQGALSFQTRPSGSAGQIMTERMRISNNGNVGIGNSNPQYMLDVNGTARIQGNADLGNDVKIYTTSGPIDSANGIIRMTTQGGVSYIQSGSNSTNVNNKLYFTNYANTASKFTMDMVNTRMGINNDSPQYTLDVNGSGRFTQFPTFSTNRDFTIELNNSPGSNRIGFFTNLQDGNYNNLVAAEDMGIIFSKGASDTGNFVIAPYGTGSKGIKIMSTGRVGIGTNTPTQTLDVNGSVWARSTLYVGSSTSTNQIRFYGTFQDGPGQTDGPFTHTVIGEYLYGGTEQSELILFKGNDANSGAGPDRVRVLASGGFRVDVGSTMGWAEGVAPPNATYENALFVSGENGRVGIGTGNPQYTLDVSGDIYTSGNITTSNSGSSCISRITGSVGEIYFQAGANTTTGSSTKVHFSQWATTNRTMSVDLTNTRVGINQVNPATTLDVNGTIRQQGMQTATFVGSVVNGELTPIFYTATKRGVLMLSAHGASGEYKYDMVGISYNGTTWTIQYPLTSGTVPTATVTATASGVTFQGNNNTEITQVLYYGVSWLVCYD
jgi:hypothetical protein